MTEARMGPTQGVQRRPSERPTIMPPKKPESWDWDPPAGGGTNAERRENIFSKRICVAGISKLSPNNPIITIATYRKLSDPMPVALTMLESRSVKNVKLTIKPATIPNGLFFPPVRELDNTIGKIGRMHGDNTVTIPARNAKMMRISIVI
jgi:hypothetical protein